MKKTALALAAAMLLSGCADTVSSSAQEPQNTQTPSSVGSISVNDPQSTPASSEEINVLDLEYTVNDMTAYIWTKQPAAEFRQVTWTEALRLFQEEGTAMLMFGYETCNYCQRAVPLLSEAAKEKNVPIYYIDVYAEPQPTEEEYVEMCGYIDETMDKDENGEPEFFVPSVIGIRNGKITGYHVSLVDGFQPVNKSDQLNDEQKSRLKNIYIEIIEKTF